MLARPIWNSKVTQIRFFSFIFSNNAFSAKNAASRFTKHVMSARLVFSVLIDNLGYHGFIKFIASVKVCDSL